jgi:2-keto-4-pentenoate hydratase
VVVSDFGNNAGLILGPAIAEVDLDLACETFIEGERVGRGRAADMPGGPLESLRFLLETCARRGRPLTSGQLISTGAVTGIHDIRAGQAARISFGRLGDIRCRARAATPRP